MRELLSSCLPACRLGRRERACQSAPTAREQNDTALGQDHFLRFAGSHRDKNKEKYGIQCQHDGPVFEKSVRVAARQKELAEEEVREHQNEPHGPGYIFSKVV